MITVDTATKEFVRLLDLAIKIAERIKLDFSASATEIWVAESASATVENLNSFRDLALAGKLPRPSKGEVPQGTGLGLARGVGEWTEDDDLLDAIYAVEDFYKQSM